MALRINQCAKVGETIAKLKNIMLDEPVQILMLASGQHGLSVLFTDLIQEPSLHTFICSVEVGNLLEGCTGYGTTKEEARMNAAEEAMRDLVNSFKDLSPSSPSSSNAEDNTLDVYGRTKITSRRANPLSKFELKRETRSGSCETASSSSKTETKKETSSSLYQSFLDRSRQSPSSLSKRGPPASPCNDNHVGNLQELAAKNSWPSPIYEEVDEYGEDHMKTFVIKCKFRTMICEGISNSKKTAKRQAAEKMLTLIDQNGTPAKRSHSSLESSQARRLRSLATPDTYPADYYCDKLQKRASKNKWTVKWHDDLGKGYSGNSLCFVRINTDPVTVCAGSGPTEVCARDDAARNALKILE